MLMLSGPVELLFLLLLIAALTCYFPVCGVSFVRNGVNELFVEGTCNGFGVNVCIVFECYGVVVLLCWSSVG